MEKKEKGKKIGHMLVKILIILIALGIASYCAVLGYLCVQEGKVPKEASELETDYDAVVVLGAQVKPDGVPSVQLSLRLDRAAEVWERKHVPVVVCGAQGRDEPEPEAYTMKRYLMDKGVPEDMILLDPDSMNTEQNIVNAKKLLEEYPGEIRKVVIVTSDYHVPRSMALAEDMDMEAAGVGSPCLQEYWLKNHGRDTLSWIKYWLKKTLRLTL